MPKVEFRNGRWIGNGNPPYVIAELNSSHNGNVENAMRMIDAAISCGCDCVKFQSWSAESLYSEEYYKDNPISKRIVAKLSLNESQMKMLAGYCKEKGIDFSSTPYSMAEVDFLVNETEAPFIKIASMEINNLPFLRYIAQTGMPMVLSTGMASLEEIRSAVSVIESTGNRKLCILHCVSIYPAAAETINLNNIKMLQQEFPEYPIGYSDHTIGNEVASASVALGAVVIEKHFTLDNKKMGMDNNMATEPHEMTKLVECCQNAYYSLGETRRIVSAEEIEQRKKMRRSLITTRCISKGEVITAADIGAKRPGTGISPMEIDSVIGKKAVIDIPKEHAIRWEHLK